MKKHSTKKKIDLGSHEGSPRPSRIGWRRRRGAFSPASFKTRERPEKTGRSNTALLADYPQHYTGKLMSLEEIMRLDWDQCPQPTTWPVTQAIRRAETVFVLDIEGFNWSSGTLTLDRPEGARIVGRYRDRNGRDMGEVRLDNINEEDGELTLSGYWIESNREPWLWAAKLTLQ